MRIGFLEFHISNNSFMCLNFCRLVSISNIWNTVNLHLQNELIIIEIKVYIQSLYSNLQHRQTTRSRSIHLVRSSLTALMLELNDSGVFGKFRIALTKVVIGFYNLQSSRAEFLSSNKQPLCNHDIIDNFL